VKTPREIGFQGVKDLPRGLVAMRLIRCASILRILSIFTGSFFSRILDCNSYSRQPILNLATRRFDEYVKPIDVRLSSCDLICILDMDDSF